jgi:hypothetical protein
MNKYKNSTLASTITYKLLRHITNMVKFLLGNIGITDKIQTVIAFGILGTAVFSFINIYLQGRFNKIMQRPWVKVEFLNDNIILVERNDSCFCRVTYRYKNFGYSPAFKLTGGTFIIDTFYNYKYPLSKGINLSDANFVLYPKDSTPYCLSSEALIFKKNMISFYTKEDMKSLSPLKPIYISVIAKYKFDENIYHMVFTEGVFLALDTGINQLKIEKYWYEDVYIQ